LEGAFPKARFIRLADGPRWSVTEHGMAMATVLAAVVASILTVLRT